MTSRIQAGDIDKRVREQHRDFRNKVNALDPTDHEARILSVLDANERLGAYLTETLYILTAEMEELSGLDELMGSHARIAEVATMIAEIKLNMERTLVAPEMIARFINAEIGTQVAVQRMDDKTYAALKVPPLMVN